MLDYLVHCDFLAGGPRVVAVQAGAGTPEFDVVPAVPLKVPYAAVACNYFGHIAHVASLHFAALAVAAAAARNKPRLQRLLLPVLEVVVPLNMDIPIYNVHRYYTYNIVFVLWVFCFLYPLDETEAAQLPHLKRSVAALEN